MINFALYFRDYSEANMRLAKQIDIADAVTGRPPGDEGPVWDYVTLLRFKQHFAEAGLNLSVIESIPVTDRIKLGLPGRDEDLDNFCQSLRNMGAAGIPILCYNWMTVFGWFRTSFNTQSRGGALVSSFDNDLLKDGPPAYHEEVTEERLWDSLDYFLKAVVPVAEEAGVKLAMHPDDPPMSPVRGVGRIMTSVDNFQRLIDLYPSPNNGITFCQGNFASMGADIPAAIKKFGDQDKIFFVHFRDVRGTVPKFVETFHDDGDNDMVAAMRAYVDIGFDGPMRPDHTPTMEGESNDHPGYMLYGRLHAVGYMKGLLQAVQKQ
ncbi:MAG: mannonate dehydratase [Anaerolineae bacterium]|nr:mannonate dehydratase [Anaerolineae bacterium]